MAKQLHIGKVIATKAKELRIGPTELGEMIGTSKQNVYSIYRRNSIDAELLQKISEALGYNFFQLYIERLPEQIKGQTGQIAALKKELSEIKERYELLKQLNELLQEKRKTKA